MAKSKADKVNPSPIFVLCSDLNKLDNVHSYWGGQTAVPSLPFKCYLFLEAHSTDTLKVLFIRFVGIPWPSHMHTYN